MQEQIKKIDELLKNKDLPETVKKALEQKKEILLNNKEVLK